MHLSWHKFLSVKGNQSLVNCYSPARISGKNTHLNAKYSDRYITMTQARFTRVHSQRQDNVNHNPNDKP